MIPAPLLASALVLSCVPLVLGLLNLFHYRRPRRADSGTRRSVSVLIPARNEEGRIAAAVRSVLESEGVELEVVVMDDASEDGTAAEVERVAAADPRVRLRRAPPLPSGWNGKQHACQRLARVARYPILVFIDADVRLAPDGLGRIADELSSSDAVLVSGVPRQLTEGLLERMLIPLIHFVLLGYLPMLAMRRLRHPALAAGCGQLVAVWRDAYRLVGGHATVASTRHDGLALPRAFRSRGYRTDLFDATPLASCRMYRGGREVWNGLAKNATEGMATRAGILPWTVLLLGGQVLPPVLLAAGWATGASPGTLSFAAAATVAGYGLRGLCAWRFRQSWLGVALHPLGIALLVLIQWTARLRESLGSPVPWKGRVDDSGTGARPPAGGEAARPAPYSSSTSTSVR